jgi:hypothetical protein
MEEGAAASMLLTTANITHTSAITHISTRHTHATAQVTCAQPHTPSKSPTFDGQSVFCDVARALAVVAFDIGSVGACGATIRAAAVIAAPAIAGDVVGGVFRQ